MKKIWIASGVIVLLVIMISVSVYRQTFAKGPAVKVVKPTTEEISSVVMIPGTVQLNQQQNVYLPADQSELKELLVKEGQKVKKGQTLAILENRQLELEVEQNKLSKESAYLKMNQLEDKEDQLKEKEEDLSEEASEKEAAKQLEPEYDQLEMDQKLANLDLKRALLEEETLNDRLNDLQIKSKIDGIVLTVEEEASATSDMGVAQPVIQLGSLAEMQVTGVLSEYDTLKIKEGQKVTLSSDAVPDQEWQGEVAAIGTLPQESESMAQAGTQAVQYPVHIKLTSETNILKPGFQLIMEIETEKKKALVLPMDALVEDGDEPFVYVVENNQAQKREVKLGITSGEQLEIVEGLTEKDKVILQPSDELEIGAEVTVE
jgi:HlyD family secretion protein